MAPNAKFLTLNSVIKMEETKIIKVYSNKKKSTRLKRRKNKFQRVWDAEKQTYVKVRKSKFTIYENKKEKTVKTVDEQVKAAFERAKRREKAKKNKSVPVNVQKPMKKNNTSVQKSENNTTSVVTHAKVDTVKQKKEVSIVLYNKKMVWNMDEKKYLEAA